MTTSRAGATGGSAGAAAPPGPRLRNFDWGGKSMGTPPSGGGGGQSDGHAFIIKLKFCHVKRFMLVLV